MPITSIEKRKAYKEHPIASHRTMHLGAFTVRVTSDTLDDHTARRYGGQIYIPNMVVRLNDFTKGYVRYLFVHVEGSFRDHPRVIDECFSNVEVDVDWLGHQIATAVGLLSDEKTPFDYHSAAATLNTIPNIEYRGDGTGVMPFLDLVEVMKGVYMCTNPVDEKNPKKDHEQLELTYTLDDDPDSVITRTHQIYTVYDHLGWEDVSIRGSATMRSFFTLLKRGINQAVENGEVNTFRDPEIEPLSVSFKRCAVGGCFRYKTVE